MCHASRPAIIGNNTYKLSVSVYQEFASCFCTMPPLLVRIPHTEDCTAYDLETWEEIVPMQRLRERELGHSGQHSLIRLLVNEEQSARERAEAKDIQCHASGES